MRGAFSILFSVFWVALSCAQDDVTLSQLEEKHYPADTTAGAVFLFTKGKAQIRNMGLDWQLITTVTNRIKIYKPSGFEYADKQIRFFSYKDFGCKVTSAATYNAENGKIVKTTVDDSEIYTETLNNYRGTKKIHLPNVKEGSIIEYTYEITTPSIWLFPKWYFQYEVPVKYSEYEVSVPTYFSINRFMTGDVGIKESAPETDKSGPIEFSVMRYTVHNVPAIKEEPLSPHIDNYLAAVWFEIAAVNYGGDNLERRFSTDWESMAKRLYDDEDFGGQISTAAYFRKDLKSVLGNGMTQLQKANAIFSMVQNHMTWNGRESYQCSNGVKQAYQNKTGNTAEINLMLLGMLKYSGIEAWPVILSTRDSGVVMYPNFLSFDYVIVLARIDGKEVLFDASSKNVKPGQLPIRALNYKGRLLSENGRSKEVDLLVAEKSKAVVSVAATVDDKGIVSGKVRHAFFDYHALAFRDVYTTGQDSLFVAVREKNNPGLTISNHLIKDIANSNLPVTEEYNFTHTDVAYATADKIYISPMLFFENITNPFIAQDRLYPVDFIYPTQKKFNFSITIPEGYAVETLPESMRLDLPDHIAGCSYSISATGNLLQFVLTVDINSSFIDKSYYPGLKDFLQKVVEKQAEKIVLKKV
jgi:Domain of Unknown Function with PDB structure (DUF3857)